VDQLAATKEIRYENVQSLHRGMEILKAFNRETPRMTLTEVATITGLSRATARRFLITLTNLGYVGNQNRYFYLRPKILELGNSYLSSLSFNDVVQQHLNMLAEELHESVSASVLEYPDIVYVARASTNRVMTIGLSVGTKLPALYTSMGRVMLAQLPATKLQEYLESAQSQKLTEYSLTNKKALQSEIDKARTQGWYLLDQELEIGLRSLAVPIGTHINDTYAAINVSVPASRVSIKTLESLILPRLQNLATIIDRDILKLWPN
jgi:IclR family pca regulon transcriptional regulator